MLFITDKSTNIFRGCCTIIFCVIHFCQSYQIVSGNELKSGLIHRKLFYNQRRYPRLAHGPIDESCRTFEEEDKQNQVFYSPGWPGPYPNNTECVKILEAPKGFLLRLDFREFFNLEKSDNCMFDFLEVRDGAHGYGQLLGQFCGSEFPPMITSTDRYLWLRFRSDENIEYTGFKAVYEYLERPTSSSFTPEMESCRININGSEGTFSNNDISAERRKLVDLYNIALDCMWVITVKPGWKIQLTFPVFKLEKPNDCESNFVDVFNERTDLPSREKNYCGSIADPITSKGNIMHIRFLTEAKAINSKFEALFTAFREKKNNEACAEDEYDCEDATCISRELRCNGRINCRFRWDEDECQPKKTMVLNSEHIIIIMIIFTLILSGMCFTFFYNCIKKLIRDHQLIQEHIRQSREHQLNVLGHKRLEEINHQSDTKKIFTDPSICLSSPNSPTQKFDSIAKENTTCYVPGGEMLPILIKGRNNHKYNGDLYGLTTSSVDETSYLSERLAERGERERERERENEQFEMCDNACQTQEGLFDPGTQPHSSPPAPFSTFGYKKEGKDDKHCMHSTKTAPDVIMTH